MVDDRVQRRLQRSDPALDLSQQQAAACSAARTARASAAYRAALEDWVARPGPDLAARVERALRALDD